MTDYAALTDTELAALIRQLQDLQRERRGKPARALLTEWVDPDGDNFLGTGLTLREFVTEGTVRRFAQSYSQQDRPERRRRLDFVVELATAYQELRRHTGFATGVALTAIEAVIEGDWTTVADLAKEFQWRDEVTFDADRYRALYADYVAILDRVVRSIPPDGATTEIQ